MSLFEPRIWEGAIFLGEWTPGGAGEYPAVSPATGEEIARVGRASVEDGRRAAERAGGGRAGLGGPRWVATPFNERAGILRRPGDLWVENGPEIHDWLARETGSIRPKGEFETYV